MIIAFYAAIRCLWTDVSGSQSLIHTPISAKGKMMIYSKFFNSLQSQLRLLRSRIWCRINISHNDKVCSFHTHKKTNNLLSTRTMDCVSNFFTNLLLSQFCGLVINIFFVAASNCTLISISVFSAQQYNEYTYYFYFYFSLT